MSRKWYGSLNNRIAENKQYCEQIEVGTGMTEYSWSDRHAYEVVEVIDQKHVWVREYDHKKKDDTSFSNNWELISNENNPKLYITKRGKYWYWTVKVDDSILDEIDKAEGEEKFNLQWFLCQNNILIDELREKKHITKYHRANVSFGVADYYYDYEF